MAEWKYLEIPAALVGEKRAFKSSYVTTYQTEILLPKNSEYAGYCFLHPSKLVGGSLTIAKIIYNDSFSFKLFKKDRDAGKRYKRYTLTVPEILKVYEKETGMVKAKLEKKEQNRLAQIGSVEAVWCENSLWGNKMVFLFHNGKQYYYGDGSPYGTEKHVGKSKVIASNVRRSVFEASHELIQSLWEEYRMFQEVRDAVQKCNSHATEKVHTIGDSFENLCDKWEKEFLEKAADIIKQGSSITNCITSAP